MAQPLSPKDVVGRRVPASGVHLYLGQPTLVFLTVCAKDRRRWLARTQVQQALEEVWCAADAWRVGYYLLMPDHLHLFCAPRDVQVLLPTWVKYWKREFSRRHLPDTGSWQRSSWDTRLRRSESYAEKWAYVRENPVRQGLVVTPQEWPYWGMLNTLRW